MRTIAVINRKGGVAKTSTVINMAAILAKDYGQNVLVIDADSQHNTTDFFGGDPVLGNVAQCLRDKDQKGGLGRRAVEKIQCTTFSGIFLLCGDDSLMDLDLTSAQSPDVNVGVLRDMRFYLESAEADTYQWCFIDCPPSFDAASSAALLMADEVLIPLKLDAFSIAGMANMMRQIANMRRINPALRLLGVLPTMWHNGAQMVEAERTIQAAGIPVLGHIRRSDKVDDMTFVQRPLVESSPWSGACIDYRRFVMQLMGGEEKNG